MKVTPVRTPLSRALFLGTSLACAAALAPHAAAQDALFSVDAAAPLQATLLQTVSISAHVSNPARVEMHVAPGVPIPVSLLPTVHVWGSGLAPLTRTDPIVAPERAPLAAADTSPLLPVCIDARVAPCGALAMRTRFMP